MKLIFLDMDGVMNSTQSSRMHWVLNNRETVMLGFDHICPIAASNLDWLLERAPDAKIVISSTWRLHYEIEEWHEKMQKLCPAIVGRVIDKTPSIARERLSQPVPRGHEIYKWLEDNNHLSTPYVIFDDDKDMAKVENHFIWCDPDLGLTYKNIFDVFLRWGISP